MVAGLTVGLAAGAPLQRVPPHAHAVVVPAQKLTARVERPIGVPVFDGPGGRRLGRLTMRTEWGSRRVMPVIAHEGPWLRVLADVPGRRSGWILAAGHDLRPPPRPLSPGARPPSGPPTPLHPRPPRPPRGAALR